MKFLSFAVLACLLALAAVPVVMTPPLYFPFITGKTFAFEILVELAATGWAVLAVFDPRRRPVLSRLPAAFLGVVVLALLSDLSSDNPRLAFFSKPDRMEGFFLLAHLFALFVVASAMLDTKRRRRAFFGALVLGSMGVAAVAFYQLALFIGAGVWRAQVWSTLGNASFLGQYAALMAFIAAFLAQRSRGWLVAVAVDIAVVGLAQSRGAVLALLVGGGIYAIARASRFARVMVLIGAAIVFAALLPTSGTVPLLHRFQEASLSDPRIAAWETGIEAARARPLLGWGDEGFWQAHNAYCRVDCGRFDRAHNLLVDRLVSGGVMGVWAWFLLLVAGRRAVREGYAGGERAALYAFLAAYVVSDLTLFDTLTSYLPLVSVLAVVSVDADPA